MRSVMIPLFACLAACAQEEAQENPYDATVQQMERRNEATLENRVVELEARANAAEAAIKSIPPAKSNATAALVRTYEAERTKHRVEALEAP